MLPVLLTGPSGRVGREVVPMLRERFDLRTFDLTADPNDPKSFAGDLQDIEELKTAMNGCQAVIHLAATSDEAPFEQLLPNNLIGVHNVLEAAVQSGVKRVIFASTIQAIGRALHRDTGEPYHAHELPQPGSMYGATKVWGEALGNFYRNKHGLEFIAVRIGAFQPYDSDWMQKGIGRDIWLSPRDCFQLLWRAVETPDIQYAIVHGTSRTPRELMSLSEGRELLGYEPQDNADDYYVAEQK